MILRPNWNPANPAGAKISSNESISPSAGCLPSDSARSPAKQRASASTSHVTNRLLEYRRGSWSDSVHSWFREMTRFDRRGEPSNMLMDDGRAFFRLVLVSLGHRIVSTYCWNAEFQSQKHRTKRRRQFALAQWPNQNANTQHAVSCCILNRIDSRFASSSTSFSHRRLAFTLKSREWVLEDSLPQGLEMHRFSRYSRIVDVFFSFSMELDCS